MRNKQDELIDKFNHFIHFSNNTCFPIPKDSDEESIILTYEEMKFLVKALEQMENVDA